ncbi:hypothetical protein [Tsuneonella suprasediminis]|uniref:hypothetical protein n=1 Tax=Tsuneonella suprasediminis TaxID=2306996 RepID=UPI00140268A2|nr:hypothetical protein [Tsuneonella suprasediminis]
MEMDTRHVAPCIACAQVASTIDFVRCETACERELIEVYTVHYGKVGVCMEWATAGR